MKRIRELETMLTGELLTCTLRVDKLPEVGMLYLPLPVSSLDDYSPLGTMYIGKPPDSLSSEWVFIGFQDLENHTWLFSEAEKHLKGIACVQDLVTQDKRDDIAIDRKVALAQAASSAHLRAWAGTTHVQEAIGKAVEEPICGCCGATRLDERPNGVPILYTNTKAHVKLPSHGTQVDMQLRSTSGVVRFHRVPLFTAQHAERRTTNLCFSNDDACAKLVLDAPTYAHKVELTLTDTNGRLMATRKDGSMRSVQCGASWNSLVDGTAAPHDVTDVAVLQRAYNLSKQLAARMTPTLAAVELVQEARVDDSEVRASYQEAMARTISSMLQEERGDTDGQVRVVDMSGSVAAEMEEGDASQLLGLDAVPDRQMVSIQDVRDRVQELVTTEAALLADVTALMAELTPQAALSTFPGFHVTPQAAAAMDAEAAFVAAGTPYTLAVQDGNSASIYVARDGMVLPYKVGSRQLTWDQVKPHLPQPVICLDKLADAFFEKPADDSIWHSSTYTS